MKSKQKENKANGLVRCAWAGDHPLLMQYHDREWGIPLHDELRLFQLLILECKHAGLSWLIVLKKREGLMAAFDDFVPERLLAFSEERKQALLTDERVIRHGLKVNMVFKNAKVYMDVVEKHGSLDQFLWRYVDGKPLINHFQSDEEIPASTPLSERISKDMKKLGFSFVGPVTVYAFMQAMGMVNDHIVGCDFRHVDEGSQQ